MCILKLEGNLYNRDFLQVILKKTILLYDIDILTTGK